MTPEKDNHYKINDLVIVTNCYSEYDDIVTIVGHTPKVLEKIENRVNYINNINKQTYFYKVIENKKMYGFKILVQDDDNLTNQHHQDFIIVDPRGFKVFLTVEEAQKIIRDSTIINGNIMNELVYVTNKDRYFLTVVGSSTYNKYASNAMRLN